MKNKKASKLYQLKFQEILKKQNIIIYSDGFKSDNESTGAGIYIIDNYYQLYNQQ